MTHDEHELIQRERDILDDVRFDRISHARALWLISELIREATGIQPLPLSWAEARPWIMSHTNGGRR